MAIERDGPLLLSGSTMKSSFARMAGLVPSDDPALTIALRRTLQGVDRTEAEIQHRFGAERRASTDPKNVFIDDYTDIRPFDRFLPQIALAKVTAATGSNRLKLVQDVVKELSDVETPLNLSRLQVAVNDCGWSFVGEKSGHKEVHAKPGNNFEDIAELAEHMKTLYGDQDDPFRVRSEAATVLLPDHNRGYLIESVLDLGRFNPNIPEEELTAIIAAHSGASAGFTVPAVLENGLTIFDPEDDQIGYKLRLIGIKKDRQWQPVEPTVSLEEEPSEMLMSRGAELEPSDYVHYLHAQAHGLTPGLDLSWVEERAAHLYDPSIKPPLEPGEPNY